MNFFHHKDLGNHLLQLCPKVVKHPVYNCMHKEDTRNKNKFVLHKNVTSLYLEAPDVATYKL